MAQTNGYDILILAWRTDRMQWELQGHCQHSVKSLVFASYLVVLGALLVSRCALVIVVVLLVPSCRSWRRLPCDLWVTPPLCLKKTMRRFSKLY